MIITGRGKMVECRRKHRITAIHRGATPTTVAERGGDVHAKVGERGSSDELRGERGQGDG